MENQGLSKRREDQDDIQEDKSQQETKDQRLNQRRKTQEDKRKGPNQALIIEGMIRRFEHMLNSPHFDESFKNKLLTDMQKAIDEYKGIIGE